MGYIHLKRTFSLQESLRCSEHLGGEEWTEKVGMRYILCRISQTSLIQVAVLRVLPQTMSAPPENVSELQILSLLPLSALTN